MHDKPDIYAQLRATGIPQERARQMADAITTWADASGRVVAAMARGDAAGEAAARVGLTTATRALAAAGIGPNGIDWQRELGAAMPSLGDAGIH